MELRDFELRDFFENNKRVAVAFSGGVDSAYLLAEAVKYGADVKAYYVKSAFQPEFEREDARRLAKHIGAEMREIEVDVLSNERIAFNPEDRCYYCKQRIMSSITEAAKADGFDIVCDGTNASDDISDRPGFRALAEFGIRSPLKECGITKADLRLAARELGLDVWDKPAYACLATRIAHGEEITEEKLATTEKAEGIIHDMGFRDFRVRMRGNSALVQIERSQHAEAVSRRDEIVSALGGMYDAVTIDEVPR